MEIIDVKDGITVVGPSGTKYHLPFGQEVERVDTFLRRMKLTDMLEKLRDDVDTLLDVRIMYQKEA